jgi:hypothetical protein
MTNQFFLESFLSEPSETFAYYDEPKQPCLVVKEKRERISGWKTSDHIDIAEKNELSLRIERE